MSTKHERRTVYATKRWGLLRDRASSPETAACASGAARKAERSLPKSSTT